MKYPSTISMVLLMASITLSANAQINQDMLHLNIKDEYKKTSSMSSSVTMKRGNKQLDIETASTITKSYRITDATSEGYELSISTTQITDTISAFGNKVAYSTDNAPDLASAIEVGLSNMTRVPSTVSIDKSGKITKVKSSSAGVFNANLVAVTGVYENQLQEGETAGLGFDFTIPAAATIGKTWTESVKRETGSKKTSYTIKDITDKTTTVTFISEIEETGANTNLNGLVVLENATGIVLQRIIKSNTSSYETMNDIVYAASRKNILVEVCSKVN